MARVKEKRKEKLRKWRDMDAKEHRRERQ